MRAAALSAEMMKSDDVTNFNNKEAEHSLTAALSSDLQHNFVFNRMYVHLYGIPQYREIGF